MIPDYRKTMENIEFKISSTSDWSTISKANEFVDILVCYKEFLLPEKYDRQEPERFKFNPCDLSGFIDRWTSKIVGFHIKRKKPYSMFMLIDIWKKKHGNFNSITASIDTMYFQNGCNTDRLLGSVNELYSWGAIDHGYICHRHEKEKKNKYFVEGEYDPIGRLLPKTGGTRLHEGLPGIYWANYFGPIYVKFFGPQKFLSVPAYYKEELPDGGFLLLTSKTPFEYSNKKVQKLAKEIIEHLGRDAFFEKSNANKICVVPDFEFKQRELGQPVEIYACDEVKHVIPDSSVFISKVHELINSLEGRLKKTLNMSFHSLHSIDSFINRESRSNPVPWEKEKGKQILQELTAYYGEVFRRQVNGTWAVQKGSAEEFHPVILFKINNKEYIEYPFVRINKFWSERDRSDALSNKFHIAIKGF